MLAGGTTTEPREQAASSPTAIAATGKASCAASTLQYHKAERATAAREGLHCIAPYILLPSYCDQVFKRGLILNFSTHVLLGDVPGRLVPLRKRGEQLLFADEPD